MRFDSYRFNIASWVFGWFFTVVGCWIMAAALSIYVQMIFGCWTTEALWALQTAVWIGLVLPLAMLLPLYLTLRVDDQTNEMAWLIVIVHLSVVGAYACLYLIMVRPDGSKRVNARRATWVR